MWSKKHVASKELSPEQLNDYLVNPKALKKQFRADALKGRRALVVGALENSIGEACARMLLEFGCEFVVLHGENEEAVGPTYRNLVQAGFNNCSKIVADLSRPGSGRKLAERVDKKCEGIDIVVYVSGWSGYISYREPDPKLAAQLLQINLVSAAEVFGFYLDKHLERRKRNRKARLDLCGCSSIQGLVAAADDAGFYSASKAGIEHYLRGLGIQYAKMGVHTHCVAPGCVDTKRHRSTDQQFKSTRKIGRATPWGILAPPWAIAGAFLGSIATPYYKVGELIVVDGGWRAAGCVNARGQERKPKKSTQPKAA